MMSLNYQMDHNLNQMFNIILSIFYKIMEKILMILQLEIIEVVLVLFNNFNNGYQQDSRVLYTFVPNKPFGTLLEISPKNRIFLKTFDLEFQEIKVWFTDEI